MKEGRTETEAAPKVFEIRVIEPSQTECVGPVRLDSAEIPNSVYWVGIEKAMDCEDWVGRRWNSCPHHGQGSLSVSFPRCGMFEALRIEAVFEPVVSCGAFLAGPVGIYWAGLTNDRIHSRNPCASTSPTIHHS